MTEIQKHMKHSIINNISNKNIFYKIKLGFYWYRVAFNSWKTLMTLNESDTYKIDWERGQTFFHMNYFSELMEVDSELKYNDKFIESINSLEKSTNVFNEKIIKNIVKVSKNKKFEWEDEEPIVLN